MSGSGSNMALKASTPKLDAGNLSQLKIGHQDSGSGPTNLLKSVEYNENTPVTYDMMMDA